MTEVATLFWWALAIVLLGGLAVPVAYLIARALGIGWFRSKLDFIKLARKLKNGER